MALVWVWLALKAAIGDDGAQSDGLLGGTLLIVGLMCLILLLTLRDGSQADQRQAAYPNRYQDQVRPGQLRRRYERRIVADSRRKGVPQMVVSPLAIAAPRVFTDCSDFSSVRAAKIKIKRAKSKAAVNCALAAAS